MKCKDCKYFSYVDGTIFCDSRNHKRRTVRIDREYAERDIDCYWLKEKIEGKRDAYNDIRLDLFNEIERTQAVKENEK